MCPCLTFTALLIPFEKLTLNIKEIYGKVYIVESIFLKHFTLIPEFCSLNFKAFFKSTSLILASILYSTFHMPNISHSTYPTFWISRTSHILNILQSEHPTSQTSHISNMPYPERHTSQTDHIPTIPHSQYPTYLTSHILNIPHYKYRSSPASQIPNMPYPEYPASRTSHILKVPHLQHLTSRTSHI